jgi:hypothetical protein
MQVTCPKAISCARPAAPSSRPNILTLTQPRTRVVEVVYDNNRKVMIHTAAQTKQSGPCSDLRNGFFATILIESAGDSDSKDDVGDA